MYNFFRKGKWIIKYTVVQMSKQENLNIKFKFVKIWEFTCFENFQDKELKKM